MFETDETVASAMLVATMLTVCDEATAAGAVYTPAAEMDPTAGLVDQRIALLVEPVTTATKACVCEG